jgi:hypothetical protein
MTLSTQVNVAAWVLTAACCTQLALQSVCVVWPPRSVAAMMAPFLFAGRWFPVGHVVGRCIGRAIRSRGP